jgi:hypothetical protein
MDEFEQPQNLPPLEVATQIILEDHWNIEPRYAPIQPNPDDPEHSMVEPGFGKIAPAFGERVVGDAIQACSLEDLVVLHQEIAHVLGDEHSHTAILTIAPQPRHGVSGDTNEVRANNDAWLIAIRNGHWPLPGSYRRLNSPSSDQPPEYSTDLSRDPHDTADNHIAFMLLAPREMQDQLTEAAEHGITELLEALDHPHKHGGLLLSGERRDDNDPLAFSWRGTSRYDEINGMGVVDEISDEPSFMPVMQDLLVLDGSEARQAYVNRYMDLIAMPPENRALFLKQAAIDALGDDVHREAYRWISSEEMKVDNIVRQMRSIVAITNFNTRQREGRNMTDAEQAGAKQAYLAGLVRVADKLSGDYQPQAA